MSRTWVNFLLKKKNFKKMHDTIFFSACDLINLYKSKKLSPVENLKNTFDIIKKLNPKLNAFISIAEKRAMKQAKFSELNYLNNSP